ncbi:Maf family protein [Desulfurivibrio sp. D14AmB]|uniref:Maf family protein n=1 Tax=Desulfurivibrio sp. D14AmB TaxID=3374370 RepID=UPI00376F0307
MFLNRQPLILASASPRRREMLSGLGIAFTVRPAAIVEEPRPGEKPAAFAARLAEEKARAVAGHGPGSWVLAADTVVAVADEILGKPADAAAAGAMLLRLSDRWHRVFSAFCLVRENEIHGEVVATEVRFASASPELIAAYVATGEPLDKAGAYGIQGLGGVLVREIRGSHSNVIGLPLAEVVAALLALGVVACAP